MSSASSRHFYFSSCDLFLLAFRRCPKKYKWEVFLLFVFQMNRTRLEKFVTWIVEKCSFDVFSFNFLADAKMKIRFSAPVVGKIFETSTFFSFQAASPTKLSTKNRFQTRSTSEKGWKFSLWSFFPSRREPRNFRVCVHSILSSALIARVFLLFASHSSEGKLFQWRWWFVKALALTQRWKLLENLLS